MEVKHVKPVSETWKITSSDECDVAAHKKLLRHADDWDNAAAAETSLKIETCISSFIDAFFCKKVAELDARRRHWFRTNNPVERDVHDPFTILNFHRGEETIALGTEFNYDDSEYFYMFTLWDTGNSGSRKAIREMVHELMPQLQKKFKQLFTRVNQISMLVALPFLGPQYRDDIVKQNPSKKNKEMMTEAERRGALVADIFAMHQFSAIKPRLDEVADALGHKRQTSLNAQQAMRLLLEGLVNGV